MRPAILIHGPTASGKTRLAIALAKRLDGEIINADAMQSYRDLDILTARPDADELAAAPHHLFGHVDAAQRHSAGDWTKEAVAKINALNAAGKVPILVGGTHLYIQNFLTGMFQGPGADEDAHLLQRAAVRHQSTCPATWASLKPLQRASSAAA